MLEEAATDPAIAMLLARTIWEAKIKPIQPSEVSPTRMLLTQPDGTLRAWALTPKGWQAHNWTSEEAGLVALELGRL